MPRTYEQSAPGVIVRDPSSIEHYVDQVLSHVPGSDQRERIELELRSRLAARQIDATDPRAFGDPLRVAESYLESVPLRSASFLSRVAAALIDIPSVFVTGFLIFYFACQLMGRGDQSFIAAILSGNPIAMVLGVASLFVMSPLYYIAADTTTTQTVGKALLGIRVVRESGAKVSIGQAIVRQIPLMFSFYVLDAAFALFTEKKQRAFELISRTRVVRA